MQHFNFNCNSEPDTTTFKLGLPLLHRRILETAIAEALPAERFQAGDLGKKTKHPIPSVIPQIVGSLLKLKKS